MPPLLKVIAKRVLLGFLTLVLVSITVFAATQALPGDTAQAILGKDATPEQLIIVQRQLGLDRSAASQFASWLSGLAKGDLGDSLVQRRPVTELLKTRVLNSLLLVVLGAIVSIPLSLIVGSLSGAHRDRAFDTGVQLGSLVIAAMPEFVIGMLLIIAFSTQILHLFPAVAMLDSDVSWWAQSNKFILPCIALVLGVMPYIVRMLRASMIEVLESEYVQMARLKGIRERIVLRRHALPNAIVPAIQVIALNLAWLAGGVVVIEYLFNYPGIGSALVDAVSNRDVPVIQAITLLIASIYVALNLAADILTILISPRLRTGLR